MRTGRKQMPNKKILFYAGPHVLDTLGAVRVLAEHVIKANELSYQVSVVGNGMHSNVVGGSDFEQFDLRSQYRRRSIWLRALSSVLNRFKLRNELTLILKRELKRKEDDVFESVVISRLRAQLGAEEKFDYFIGLSGYTHPVFKTLPRGTRLCIHSQWCHPEIQEKALSEEYRALGLPPPPQQSELRKRQLVEYEMADRIWCPSRMVQQSLVENGVDIDKTFVSHICVATEYFSDSKTHAASSSRFTILFVGRISIQKGIHILFEALSLSQLRGINVILNGSPDADFEFLMNKWLRALEQRDINILVSPGDPRRYFSLASVFVLPSVHDAYGICVVEAMAAGLPVIVSNHVGAHECVEQGGNGYVFDSGDTEMLAELIARIYYDTDLQASLGKRSRELSKKYDLSCSTLELTSDSGGQ